MSMTINRRLLVSFGALALLIGSLGFTGVYAIRRMAVELNDYSNATVPKLLLFGELRAQFIEARLSVRRCMYFAEAKQNEAFEAARRDFVAATDRASAALDQLKPLMITEKGRKLVAELTAGLSEYRTVAPQVFTLLAAGNSAEGQRLTSERLTPVSDRLVDEVAGFMTVQRDYVGAA